MHGRFSTIGDTCPGCPLSLRYPTYITLYRVHLHHHTTPQISSHKFKLPVNTRSLHYAVHCSAARVQLHQCAVNRPCGAARRHPRRRPASGGPPRPLPPPLPPCPPPPHNPNSQTT